MNVFRNKMLNSRLGFTLIETMIVAAIIAILAGIAIPGFIVWLPNYRLKSAAQDIYSDLQTAKMLAVKDNSDKTVQFNIGSKTYTKADGTVVDIDEEYSKSVFYGKGDATEQVDGTSFTGDYVTYSSPDDEASFNSRGMGNNSGNGGTGFVYIANSKGKAYAIGSRSSGVVLLRKWDSTAGKWR